MILITGGSGQLGTSLRNRLRIAPDIVLAPTHSELDIADPGQVNGFFQQRKPDVVLHCAAFNDVDRAEEEPELCFRTNTAGTGNLAEACRRAEAYLIYISSDYVFDGMKQGVYETSDAKRPLSVYGRSKAWAEEIVLESSSKNAVLRISWLFGFSQNNFVEAILRAAAGQREIRVVSDQFGSPTYTEDLAGLMLDMIRRRPNGIFHATNEGVCSRAQFAAEILRLAGSQTSIDEVSSAEYPSKAHRPRNSSMSKASLDRAGLCRLPVWTDALARYFEQRKGLGKCR